jgi:hypothetical protein
MMDYWKIQDIFHERMKKDYEGGVITNPTFKPYFDWKFYNAPIKSLTREMCFTIMKEAQNELEALDLKHHPTAHEQVLAESTLDDVWKPYKGYGKDCYLYSYMIGIECEITNIMIYNG